MSSSFSILLDVDKLECCSADGEREIDFRTMSGVNISDELDISCEK